MKLPTLYFTWLQKDNPVGTVEPFPELKKGFETTVPGIYCIGDLSGIPLIKLAAESGYELVEKLARDESFAGQRNSKTGDTYDLVIVGAGPAGVSASLQASRYGFSHVIIESSRMFNTIANFPAQKPIYVTPAEPPMKSSLTFGDGTKETLMEELENGVKDQGLPLRMGETAKKIVSDNETFNVETSENSYHALRVIVAIGKSGNARNLGVKGENNPRVFTRLIDPGEFHGKEILVVGGGDSAIEAAVALAKAGNRVTLSYRKAALSRPKEQNLAEFEKLADTGHIIPMFESAVKEIRENDAVLSIGGKEKTVSCNAVFVLIGTEIPIEFFRRSNIRIQGEKKLSDWIQAAGLLFFASLLYFGKKAPVTRIDAIGDFFRLPGILTRMSWVSAANGIAAAISLAGLAVCLVFTAVHFIANRRAYFSGSWNRFKYGYFAFTAGLFSWLYVSYKLTGQKPVFGDMGDWYTLMYSLTIVFFGTRRIAVNPTGYIKRQTYVLMAIQVIPLFVLPMFVFPFMAKNGMLGDWIPANVFPHGSYWRAYGLILAWPLFIHNLATGQPTVFWLWAGIIQTFVIIPLIIYKWGKGAYCGWICSCGALAETLGDEYRTTMPHGPAAKKWDNAGQVVLWFAAFVTILAIAAGSNSNPWSRAASDIYAVVVDIVFAGVLGVGVYFFMSGRFWCRFLCPLAALMHIYARFSLYRIFSNKKRCISCNICARICHMGIDVMGYANRGIPMNDVECVRCSACVVNCPMQVLTFGSLDRMDPDNTRHKQKSFPLTPGWRSGLPEKDIDMLLKLEKGNTPKFIPD